LLFQVLDHKKDCVGYFADNHIHSTGLVPSTGTTWELSEHMHGEVYELGRIYSQGAPLTDVCPEEMKPEWDRIKKALKSCLRAFRTARLSLDENCLYDVIPETLLFEYLNAKNKITEHVVNNYPRPKNHDALLNLNRMLADVGSRQLNVTVDPIKHLLGSVRGRNFHRTLQSVNHTCQYNAWGTVTGRLSTQPHTFPILTMNKEFRPCIHAVNDYLVELDFNAAELRVLLALAEQEQPQNDIHDWNVRNIFSNTLTREEAKVQTFSWLYSSKENKDLERLYNKDLVQNKYWDGCKIETDYGRIIDNVDDHRALNYIVQSTTIDMVHEQAYKVFELLKDKKSYISFLIHDAVYIDLADEDRYDLVNLLDTFKKTRYDVFKVNVSAGKHLGAMKELRL
jgi:hypothetical protein